MNKSEKIINELFILARDKERVAKAKVVAAVVHKGKIVSYGFNQYRTSWMQRKFKKNDLSLFLHAEVDAIKNALKVADANTVKNSTLYVVRSRKIAGKHVFGEAKPCRGCESCIKWFDMKRVYYSTDENTYEAMEI